MHTGAAASADPSEPSDDVLLAAAMEVDSQRECVYIYEYKHPYLCISGNRVTRVSGPVVAPPAVSPPGPSLPPAVPPAGDGPGQPANLASSSGAEVGRSELLRWSYETA